MEDEPLVNSTIIIEKKHSRMDSGGSVEADLILNSPLSVDSGGGGGGVGGIEGRLPGTNGASEPSKKMKKVGFDKEDNFIEIEKFHEDALEQAGHGKMQLILFLISGLALSADLSELLALIMSTKSSQFEFCIDESQKSWIVGACLIGMGFGSIFFGMLGDKVGRARALRYSLGFSSIFSLSSVVMPTEGTFLTARVFAGIGLGGCMPLAISYFGEFVQERSKRFATTLLFLFWPLGAAYVLLISWLILPSTGYHMSEELKEHFSSWRRLLLASWAPCGLALVFLIFVPEAPLTLMLNGRDAEALDTYKRIHKRNKGSEVEFRFSELELPPVYKSSVIPRSPLGDLSKALSSLWASFMLLWTGKRSILTITLILIWFMTAMGQGALSSWVISLQSSLRDWTFDKDAKTFKNELYFSSNITNNMVNIRYRECIFDSVSIQNIMMNHVKFENSTFKQVTFSHVKTSYVLFKDSTLIDCYFVDSDFGRSNFKNCEMINISFAGVDSACANQIPDFSSDLSNDILDSGLPVAGIVIGCILSVFTVPFLPRDKLAAILLLFGAFTSICLTIWKATAIWAMVGHSIINILLAGIWSILVTTSDMYPSLARGVALGICCSAGRLGSFFGVGLFGTTLRGILVPIFSSIFLVLASCLAFRGQF